MRLGAVSSVFLNEPLRVAAEKLHALGLESIEIGAGGFYAKNQCDPARLVQDAGARRELKDTLAEFELTISAFALHGEPLHPDPAVAQMYDADLRATCALAEQLGVTRITLLAGLPEAAPGDTRPNWIVYPFPPHLMDALRWQWEERLIPYWVEHGKLAENHGVRLCFEMHPMDLVFRPAGLLRLRAAVGPVIGCNFDPSHLWWQGIDPLAAIHRLGEAIYHSHAKDARIEPEIARVDGVLETAPFSDAASRSWLFRTVGYGHGKSFWRDFVSTLRLVGYEDVISIEHEDALMDPEEGLERAAQLLHGVLLRKSPAGVWFE